MSNFIKIISILALLFSLSACSDAPRCDDENCASVRFKVIAQFVVDGQIKEFSNVMQVNYTRFEKASGLGFGGKTQMWGEAMVLDFEGRGKAFMLPYHFHKVSKSISPMLQNNILKTAKIKASTGSLSKADIAELKKLDGTRLLNTNGINVRGDKKFDLSPTFIGFLNIANPKSVYQIHKDNFSAHFGAGVKFKNFSLEITDNNITSGVLENHLSWLSEKYEIPFERRPRGVPRKNTKIGWVITYNSFYLPESL